MTLCWQRFASAVLLPVIAVASLGFVGCAAVIRGVGPAVAPGTLWRVECSAPVIALTIDDGPVPGVTDRLLNVLRARGASATFFLVGERAEEHPELVHAIVDDGHELGNHTWTESMTRRLDAEQTDVSIRDTHQVLSDYAQVVWLRPGSALHDDDVLAVAESLGYRLALGDTWPYDTFVTSTGFHQWYILNSVRPGSIVVLHNAHGRGARAAETLWGVLPRLQERGYEVVSLSQLVAHPSCQGEAVTVQNSAAGDAT
jgi:peptidoglycan/xylan/chitin deacetylase (PgdA/CDA1 family)